MIRRANKFDLPELRNMMRQFRSESPISFLRDIDNESQFDMIVLRAIAGAGVCFIWPGKGFILGAVFPSIWCSETLILGELAWYVKPEYRGGTTGYRLLTAYLDVAHKMKTEGRVKAVTIAKMASSPDLQYQKFGFSKLEESWVQ